ncbi:histidine--tRNA ligase, partial [Aestuariibaculum suncheonense]|nr:histidine--tRNA ligase [Aestuariibaculum suncheonense]
KMKAQFKAADRLKAKFVAILGEEELSKGIINVKNMDSGEQSEVAIEELSTFLKQGK